MKKLLLTLGTVAAVAAPVASVVACGSNSNEFLDASRKVVSDILSQTKYKMEDSEKESLAKYLAETAGNHKLSIEAIKKGLLKDQSHGENDFMVILKGAPMLTIDGATATDKELSANDAEVGSSLDSISDILKSRWGYNHSDETQASFIIYLQDPATPIDNLHGDPVLNAIQVNRVAEQDGKYFELDKMEAEVNRNIFSKVGSEPKYTVNAPYALRTFAAQAPTV